MGQDHQIPALFSVPALSWLYSDSDLQTLEADMYR
jgi:hypothetical protein